MEFKKIKGMFKLGKKQILGLVTVAAIATTTMGSFAAWDKMSATATGASVTFDRVTVADVNMNVDAFTEEERLYDGTAPTYTGTVTFDVKGIPTGMNAKLTLAPSVKNAGTELDKFEFTVKKGFGESATTLTDKTDTITNGDTSNMYTIVITPKADATMDDIPNTALDVVVEATLSAPQLVS